MSKVYTYDYDSIYDPAMPVVDIELGRAGGEPALKLTALVDSGADATIVPLRYLVQVNARRSRKKWMRGTAGGRILVDLYLISLKLGPFVTKNLAAVGDTENEELIVGRDVLNHLAVFLNGPANAVEIIADDA
jgi:predicted aspartyl protease